MLHDLICYGTTVYAIHLLVTCGIKLSMIHVSDEGEDDVNKVLVLYLGGTLKIYGETINSDVPYKTLLLSVNDTAAFVVKETLDKYGLDKEDPDNYCLTEVCESVVTIDHFSGGMLDRIYNEHNVIISCCRAFVRILTFRLDFILNENNKCKNGYELCCSFEVEIVLTACADMVDVKWCVVTRVCRWCYHQEAWSTAVGSRDGRSTSWKMTNVLSLYCSSSFPIKVWYRLIFVHCVNESQLVFCCLVKSKSVLCDLTSDYSTL